VVWIIWTLGEHRVLEAFRKGGIRSSLGFGDRVLALFYLYFHLDLLEDEQRLSMGEFDKCNYLHLSASILCSLYEVLAGYRCIISVLLQILSHEVNLVFYVIFEAKLEIFVRFRSYKRVKAWRNSLRPLKYVKRSLLA
jgi:hypothetical protein